MRPFPAASVAFASVFLLFSGCVGSGGGASTSGSESPNVAGPATLDPNGEVGGVDGSVSSDDALPIEGAAAGIRTTEFTATTDATGHFQIVNIPPGKYDIDVAKLGYASSARNIEIKAGEFTRVAFTLQALSVSNDTYAQTAHFGGYLECSMGLGAWVSACSWPYTAVFLAARDGYCKPPVPTCIPKIANLSQYGAPQDIQNNQYRFNFSAGPKAKEVISEATWTPSSAAATIMQLSLHCGKYDPILDECAPRYPPEDGVAGKSPLRFDVKETVKNGLKDHRAAEKVPPEGLLWICSRMDLPFLASATQPNLQVAFGQKFDVWDTVWYNGEAPENWTIVPSSG